ncbi:MAG: 50S ribosomal protein L35 [Alcaligenaceae bacterium]|nr:50S ribosomal protein L35 [Alcaligenaceae bacterium]
MPKMKTKKSASKRFKVRGSGSIKRGQAFKRHMLAQAGALKLGIDATLAPLLPLAAAEHTLTHCC